jgi:hypothetical protein
MEPTPKTPTIVSHLNFPSYVTGFFRFGREIAVVMDTELWFYSPFGNFRQRTSGVLYHKYHHTSPISHVSLIRLGGSFSLFAVSGSFDPSNSVESNLLFLDDTFTFFVLDLSRSFICGRFESPEITSQKVTELRGSLLHEGEFVAITPIEILICQIDLSEHRRGAQIVHRHAISTQSIREFSTGYLVVQNPNLLFVEGGKCEEFFPQKLVSQFRVDNDTVITASLAHKHDAELMVVNGPSFRVRRILDFDAADGWIVILLKSKVLLIVNRLNMTQRMQIQVGSTMALGFDQGTKIICGVTEPGILMVLLIANEKLISIEVLMNLFAGGGEEFEEDEEELI